jgi:hypothetical protein
VNSGPSEKLRHTCAGISNSRTWNEPVAVREATEGHLEVLVGRLKIVSMPEARVGGVVWCSAGHLNIRGGKKMEYV